MLHCGKSKHSPELSLILMRALSQKQKPLIGRKNQLNPRWDIHWTADNHAQKSQKTFSVVFICYMFHKVSKKTLLFKS